MKKQLLQKREELLRLDDSASVKFYLESIRCRRSDPMWKRTLPRRIQLVVNRAECGLVQQRHKSSIKVNDFKRCCCYCDSVFVGESKGAEVNHLLFECRELYHERKNWTDSLGVESLEGARRGALFSNKNYVATSDYLLSVLFRERKKEGDESPEVSEGVSRETVDSNLEMFGEESNNDSSNAFEPLGSVNSLSTVFIDGNTQQ
jgi:hypothetical protein